MKQRSIRIFFILAIIAVIVFFSLVFSLGRSGQRQDGLTEYEALTTENNGAESENTDTEEKNGNETTDEDVSQGNAENETEESDDSNDTPTSAETYQTPSFYLLDTGEYLTAYTAATGEAYFETGIRTSTLPEDLQEEAQYGIVFYSLEDLYHFLENYSS